ncbi:MAG: hypothetical protein HY289_11645 [Planctomycetes bacterium]|nr:hypothetical protein [Planctomycetota bacterium]
MSKFIVCTAIGVCLMFPGFLLLDDRSLDWALVYQHVTEGGNGLLLVILLFGGMALFLYGILAGVLEGIRWLKKR